MAARAAYRAVLLAGAAVLLVGTAGLLRGVEPFASWYYHFAWAGTLLIGDAVVARTGGTGRPGRFLLLHDLRATAALFFWAAALWLFFEAINLRIQNWYYVFLPRQPALRWAGTFVAFGTVIPAVLVAESVLRGAGLRARWRPTRVTERRLRNLRVFGLICLALPLLWPRYFFPLVWLGVAPIVEPYVYRRAPRRSLLADLERGDASRLVRLLAGGAAIGLIWELLNIGARAKWIYTVPGFIEAPRLFEMPVLGFFGFPPFAVECYVVWQALVVVGLVADVAGAGGEAEGLAGSAGNDAPAGRAGVAGSAGATGDAQAAGSAGLAGSHRAAIPARQPARRVAAYALAAAGSLAVLVAMDGPTVSSLRPRVEELPGLSAADAAALRDAGYDVFRLAAAGADEVAGALERGANVAAGDAVPGALPATARAAGAVRAARLVVLRGIGTRHATALGQLGIGSVEELARADPARLATELRERTDTRVPLPRVRIWVNAARRAGATE